MKIVAALYRTNPGTDNILELSELKTNEKVSISWVPNIDACLLLELPVVLFSVFSGDKYNLLLVQMSFLAQCSRKSSRQRCEVVRMIRVEVLSGARNKFGERSISCLKLFLILIHP